MRKYLKLKRDFNLNINISFFCLPENLLPNLSITDAIKLAGTNPKLNETKHIKNK